MATTASFQAMLNDYLANDLLKEEMIKRDYLLTKIQKDDSWQGAAGNSLGNATYVVPFVGAGASSIEFGSLAASTNIAEDTFVRGVVDTQKEVWGSMIFNHRDLMEHGKNLNEKTFLKILPDRVEAFMRYMKEAVSMNLLNGPHFATAEGDGSTGGTMVVDRIDRFMLGQHISVDDDNSSPATGYVTAINVNTSTITVKDARSSGSAVDLSGYTTAQNAKIYHIGAQSNSFQSLKDALLSNANGGGASLHGQTKTSYPYLQAVNVDGSDIDSSNILDKIFDAYVEVRKKAKGNANEVLVSYNHLGAILKLIETQKGGFKVTATSQKASLYGWTEIELTSVKGQLKLVGIQELDDDVIMFIDWSALCFASNGMFRKRKSPDGIEYFEVRNTTGYQYIVDVCLFGELIVKAPGHCGIIHSIPSAL